MTSHFVAWIGTRFCRSRRRARIESLVASSQQYRVTLAASNKRISHL